MLDRVCIMSLGGIVLWERNWGVEPRRSAINELIHEVLLEDRAGDRDYVVDKLKLKWAFENQAQFLVVAVYQKFLQLVHVDKLLSAVRTAFLKKFGAELKSIPQSIFASSFEFDSEFNELFEAFAAQERSAKLNGGASAGAFAADADEDQGAAAGSGASPSPSSADFGSSGAAGNASSATFARGDSMIQTASGRVIGKKGKGGAAGPSTPAAAGGGGKGAAASASPVKKPKEARDWNKTSGVFVDPAVEAAPQREMTKEEREAAMQATVESQRKILIKRDADGKALAVAEKDWGKPKRGFVATWLRSHFGQRELDAEDFKNILPKLEEKLITKNVAVDVAALVCKSVETQIAGKKLSTFDSLQETIEEAMTNALRRILQPKREVNILRDVASAVARRRPYSIVFCGVNGVGKSTTLSKIAYWLQQNGHTIMLAAGDTFRHGAVEQLEVHARCLDVPVFQMGYGTDPSQVAGNALQLAAKNGTHVVLIDTAGRMQDHESRMRALAKLIHDNNPDLVLFVGEAVVGNNVVDQLRKFNQCLEDFAPANARPRGIDGLVLTKYDTIDDKVGASVSMVYELGQPIVFVGVGQTYQDLKTIEPEAVVSALMA